MQYQNMPKLLGQRDRSGFGRRMLRARRRANLTQVAASDLIGISQGSLSWLERVADTTTMITQFAALYRVDVNWLATGDGIEPDWESFTPPAPAGLSGLSPLSAQVAMFCERLAREEDRIALRNTVEAFVTGRPVRQSADLHGLPLPAHRPMLQLHAPSSPPPADDRDS